MRVSMLFVAALGAGCLPKVVPPRAPPAYREPSIALPGEPPAAGLGRVVIETDADPAVAGVIMSQGIHAISTSNGSGYAMSMSVRRLCTTPCVVDLPLGEHEVMIGVEGSDRAGKIVVRAEERPALVLVTLGMRRIGVGRILLGSLAWSAAFGTGLYAAIDEGESPVFMGTAIGAAVLGTVLWYSGRPVLRAASYAQYTLPQ